MKALNITNIGTCAFADVPAMPLGDGQVVLDVCTVGLCGSDLNTFKGLNPLVELPRIPGHEIGGTITELGPNVRPEIKTGENAIVIPYTTCGNCTSCKQGRGNACQFNQTLGVQRDGGLRDQIVVHQDRLIQNNTLDSMQLALVEPLSVGFHAIDRAQVTSRDTVLVLGGGMIGVGAILGAKSRGARVIVSEIAEIKQNALRALGVDHVINPQKQILSDELERLVGPSGPDVVVEAVGSAQTFRDAVELVAFSGRVIYIGYAKEEVSYNTSVFNLKELDILGSRNATRSDFEAVIAFLESNPEITKPLISRVFPWPLADQALEFWSSHRDETFKILIDMKAE